MLLSPVFDIQSQHIFTLKLPYPPSVNNYYGRTRTGQYYIKKEGQVFRQTVRDALTSSIGHKEALSQRLQVWVEVHCPDNRRRDIDNIKKALLDSLTHAGVYKDDCLIDDLRSVRCGVEKGGYVRVYVSIIKNGEH